MARELTVRPLAGRMRQAAEAWLAAGSEPAEPRPASTVVLLRAAAETGAGAGIEVYLMRRQTSMAFAAGMMVFPGGRVEPEDAAVTTSWHGPPPAWFAARMGCGADLAAAHVAAAVRETFEESGVLLAGPADDVTSTVTDTTGADHTDWEADRDALERRRLGSADFLRRRGLVLRADLLGVWAHWITPEFEPRRYDTWFFVAMLPAGQRARHATTESDRVCWVAPAAAAAAVDAGELAMLPPTYQCCAELAAVRDPAAALRLARGRALPAILPRLVVRDGTPYLEMS